MGTLDGEEDVEEEEEDGCTATSVASVDAVRITICIVGFVNHSGERVMRSLRVTKWELSGITVPSFSTGGAEAREDGRTSWRDPTDPAASASASSNSCAASMRVPNSETASLTLSGSIRPPSSTTASSSSFADCSSPRRDPSEDSEVTFSSTDMPSTKVVAGRSQLPTAFSSATIRSSGLDSSAASIVASPTTTASRMSPGETVGLLTASPAAAIDEGRTVAAGGTSRVESEEDAGGEGCEGATGLFCFFRCKIHRRDTRRPIIEVPASSRRTRRSTSAGRKSRVTG
mmetsp:Transcript_36118/g.42243  ORF Transcript_36118/g.42243 Transcript_36118/m.42243 type:complete len:287 (-) Transcript_36118:478-1338(-)